VFFLFLNKKLKKKKKKRKKEEEEKAHVEPKINVAEVRSHRSSLVLSLSFSLSVRFFKDLGFL
jgi:hypothetical protein